MADTLDVLTLTEGKAALLNNAGTNNDTLIAAYITGVSRYLDRLIGPVVNRTITAEALDGGQEQTLVSFRTFVGGNTAVYLLNRPVYSITTVTEYAGTTGTVLTAETPGVLPAEGYIANLSRGLLIRRRSGFDAAWAEGRGNIVVTYVAGRAADTASVDERYKRAAGIILANFWRREHGLGAGGTGTDGLVTGATYALPNAARALIEDELQVGVA